MSNSAMSAAPPTFATVLDEVYASQRNTLGIARNITVLPNGIVFLRAASAFATQHDLWFLPITNDVVGKELMLASGSTISAHMTAEERAQRERLRERGSGIVSFCTAGTKVAFMFNAQVHVIDTCEIDTEEDIQPDLSALITTIPHTGLFNATLSPDGSYLAAVQQGSLVVIDIETTELTVIKAASGTTTFGLANFIAAEEMDRSQGFWWSPDSSKLLFTQVDEGMVDSAWINDPLNYNTDPREIRYPASGTVNAVDTLWVADLKGNTVQTDFTFGTPDDSVAHRSLPKPGEVALSYEQDGVLDTNEASSTDSEDGHSYAGEYLSRIVWLTSSSCVVAVLNREQTKQEFWELGVEYDLSCTYRHVETQKTENWINLHASSPLPTPSGAYVRTAQVGNVTGLQCSSGHAMYDPAFDINRILRVSDSHIYVQAISLEHPWSSVIGRFTVPAGAPNDAVPKEVAASLSTANPAAAMPPIEPHQLTCVPISRADGFAVGSYGVMNDNDVVVVTQYDMVKGPETTIYQANLAMDLQEIGRVSHTMHLTEIPAHMEPPFFEPNEPVALVLRPTNWTPDQGELPVIVTSYGGPHARMVTANRSQLLIPRWWASQGFAVIVVDGPGAPGQGLDWEYSIKHDLGTKTITGQLKALRAAAERHPGLFNLKKVAIRGWSFGGYLAARGVLEFPEDFHCAISGAPVTDWHYYDTCYTERYVGLPQDNPEVYKQNSLLPLAKNLKGDLLLIHGFADDNVLVTNTMALSAELLRHGKLHTVLPLANISHFSSDHATETAITAFELEFIRKSLDL